MNNDKLSQAFNLAECKTTTSVGNGDQPTVPIFTTPVPVRRRTVSGSRIPQPSTLAQPKKGILKWPPHQSYTEQYIQPSPEVSTYPTETSKPSILQRFMMIQALVDPPPLNSSKNFSIPASAKPTVGFSEQNVVAIIGDTSDECMTEAESNETQQAADNTNNSDSMAATVAQISSLFPHKFATSTPTTAIISPIRQTNIFFSEDSEESSEATVASAAAAARKQNRRPSPLAVNSLRTIAKLKNSDSIESEATKRISHIPRIISSSISVEEPMTQSNDDNDPQQLNENEIMTASKDASITEDDSISISSASSANVVGKWWFGKNTKYVVHCDKKGCNDKAHHQSAPKLSDYLTPTQRKNKEINLLTRELKFVFNDCEEKTACLRQFRRCQKELEEKNRQLTQMRERLKEIETMMSSSQVLSENIRLVQHQREREEEFRQEREMLIERHEVRVRQLIQETIEARAEMMKKAQQIKRLREELEVEKKEQSCMTDSIIMISNTPQDELIETDKPESLRNVSPSSNAAQIIASAPTSPTSLIGGETISVKQQLQMTITQAEAYRNEALIWRTKSAQLEILIKDLMAKLDLAEKNAHFEMEKCNDAEELNRTVAKLDKTGTTGSFDMPGVTEMFPPHKLTKSRSVSNFIMQSSVTSNSTFSQSGAKEGLQCQLQSCAERKRKLIDENDNLLEKVDAQMNQITELETELDQLKHKHEKRKAEFTALQTLHSELGKLAEERLSESKAAQMSLVRLQAEREKLSKAISYLESRCQVFQNVILDNNLVVRDDGHNASVIMNANAMTDKDSEDEGLLGCEELRHGFADPQYDTYLSKGVQTDLTIAKLDSTSEEFSSLQIRLRQVEDESSTDRQSAAQKIAEIEENLALRTQLIEQLTAQLKEYSIRERQMIDERQIERDIYRKKTEELGKIAERVPILESEIEKALKAKSQLEINFRRTKELFESNVESTLAKSLKVRKEQDEIWMERLANVEVSRNNVLAQVEKLQQNFETLKLRHSAERAELEQRLLSSINHITELNNRLNCPKSDVQCEARPKTMNKYIACRPNGRQKETQIFKGDLPDDPELVKARAQIFKQRSQAKFAGEKINLLETKLLEALSIAHKKTPPQTKLSTGSRNLSFDRVIFERAADNVQIALRTPDLRFRNVQGLAENDEGVLTEEEISTASSPAILVDKRADVTKALKEQSQQHLKIVAQNEEIECLKKENNKFLAEINVLKERIFQLENEIYSKAKDKISHVSYLIPTKLEYESCDNIELAVEVNCAKENETGIESSKRLTSLPPNIEGIEDSEKPRGLHKMSSLPQLNENIEKLNSSIKISTKSTAQSTTKTPDILSGEIPKPASKKSMMLTRKLSSPDIVGFLSAPIGTKCVSRGADSFLPRKWDYERNELMERNAKLSHQLAQLKEMLEQVMKKANANTVDPIMLLQEMYNDLDTKLAMTQPIFASMDNSVSNDASMLQAEESRLKMELGISIEHNKRIAMECDMLRKRLQEAEAELEIYRKEPRQEVKLLKRCQSATELNCSDSVSMNIQEINRWKEIAGVMFRETTYLRNAVAVSEAQRLEYKTQNAMLRGEIELARCQNALVKEISQQKLRRSSLSGNTVFKKKPIGTNRPPLIRVESANSSSKLARNSPLSNSVPDIANFYELVGALLEERNQTENEKVAPAIMSASYHEALPANNAAFPTNTPPLKRRCSITQAKKHGGNEHILRHELEIIREAFQKQVAKLRTTNQNLEKRVGDLEKRVDKKQSDQDDNKYERLAIVQELEGRNAVLESECSILRAENEMYEKKIRDIEEERQQMYMIMFRKGQQAAQAEIQDDQEFDQMTEDRIVLKFLHDAFYYYLMDKGNSREHLQAILTMLNFTNAQKAEIYQRRGKSH